MDNRRYAELLDAESSKYGLWNVPRSRFGVGANSDDSICNSKGFYLIDDNKPTVDTATQRVGGQSITFVDNKFVVSYQVVDIPQEELMTTKAKELERAVQQHINTAVKARGYDDENSIAKYLVVGNPFEPECRAISLWIGNVWTYTHQVQADVQAGTREIPTTEELIAELPKLGI